MAGHLLLVGMMGSGKSTVGQALADRSGRRFVDLDVDIEREAGRSVAEIFADWGEEAFRSLERDYLARAIAGSEPLVVATGGGCVTEAASRRALHAAGVVVWLRASPPELAARLCAQTGGVTSRPLLAGDGGLEALTRRLEDLSAERAAAYEDASDVVVDVDHRPVEDVVEAILAAVEHAEQTPTDGGRP